MVATVRCEEIANEKYAAFAKNKVHIFCIKLVFNSIPFLDILSLSLIVY